MNNVEEIKNKKEETILENSRSLNVISPERRECRYCLSGDKNENLINPCHCEGTMKFVHQKCLEEWIKNGNRTITEISSNSTSVKIFMTPCEICKYQVRFTKYFKNNLFRSILKFLKYLFGSVKSVFNIAFHCVIFFLLIKRLRIFFDELMSIFKRCDNYFNPIFWMNLTHNITVLTSILVALNEIYNFYFKLLMTQRKCLISFFPRMEKIIK